MYLLILFLTFTAIHGITSYTKNMIRIATICGFIISVFSICIAVCTFVLKLTGIVTFDVGVAAISIGVYFFGSVILFFIRLIGEYIVKMNIRVMNHPLVIEDKRINFNK